MTEKNGNIISDSWEDLEDSGELDRRLKVIQPKKILQNTKNIKTSIILEDSNGRTSYKPQLRILKRGPELEATSQDRNNDQNRPGKTLEQREAEYAEARLRIMGSTNPSVNGTASQSVPSKRPNDALSQAVKELSVSSGKIVRQPKGPDGSKGFKSNRS